MGCASKSGKFVKENKSTAFVLGINTASCGEKLLQTSEHFTESLLSTNLLKLAMVQFSQKQMLLVLLLCFSLVSFILADFPLN